jgi:NADH-quinone oxidoreductase subunit N
MEYNSFKNLIILTPEIFLGTSIITLIIYGSSIVSNTKKNFPLIISAISKLTILILIFTIFLTYTSSLSYDSFFFSKTFIKDDLSVVVKITLLISAMLCLLITENYLNYQKITSFEYIIILLLALQGLLLLTSSFDLISTYLAIELQSLSFYVLAGYKKNSTFSTESGLKYFILGSFSSGFLLLGFSFVYGFTGVTNFEDISNFFFTTTYDSMLLDVALIFILVALFFKLAVAPFHLWAPDIYEGSPSISTVFFAVLPKISLLVLFVRLFYVNFYEVGPSYIEIFTNLAILSVFVGTFGALKQRKVKSLIAYSSISHAGFLLLAFSPICFEGIQALFFYIFIYMLTSICIWGVFMSINLRKHYSFKTSKHLSDFTALNKINPILALIFSVAFLSLAGIPPLVGFYAKVVVFFCAIESSLYFTTFFIILISVISAFYYLRVIKTVYFEETTHLKLFCNINYEQSFILTVIFFNMIYLFLHPNLLTLICYKISLL